MKRLHFSLEAVLELRATAKDRAAEALGRALLDQGQAAANMHAAEECLARDAAALGRQTFTVAFRQHAWDALCHQQDEVRRLKALLVTAQERVAAARAALKQAAIDHEVVARLKERWREGAAQEEAHAASLEVEDFIAARSGVPGRWAA